MCFIDASRPRGEGDVMYGHHFEIISHFQSFDCSSQADCTPSDMAGGAFSREGVLMQLYI